jgi:hypothetical protein
MRGIFWTVLFFIGLVALLMSWGPLKHPIIAVRLAFEEHPERN